MNIRILVTLLTFASCMFLFWYAGLDLLLRNEQNAFALLVGILITGAVYICPLWTDN